MAGPAASTTAGTATGRRASSVVTRARTSASRTASRDGSLTNGEANRLERGENRIDRAEAHARADGTVTPGERNRIDNMQNRESQRIYNDRHNDRTASGTTPATGTQPATGTHNWGNGGWRNQQASNTTPTTGTGSSRPRHACGATAAGASSRARPPRRLGPARSQHRVAQRGGFRPQPASGTSDGAGRTRPTFTRTASTGPPAGGRSQRRRSPLGRPNDGEPATRSSGRRSSSPCSVDLALLVAPVGLAQFALQDLARRIARQRLDEVDRLRQLVAGDAFACPVDQLAGA